MSLNINSVFCFSLQLLFETFLILRRKVSNIKFHQNPSSGSRVFPCGRTDGQDEANSRFSQFCECAYKGHYGQFRTKRKCSDNTECSLNKCDDVEWIKLALYQESYSQLSHDAYLSVLFTQCRIWTQRLAKGPVNCTPASTFIHTVGKSWGRQTSFPPTDRT